MFVSPEGLSGIIAKYLTANVVIKDERNPEQPILTEGKIIGFELGRERVHVVDNRGVRFVSGVGLISDSGYDTNPKGAVRFGRIPLTNEARRQLFQEIV